VLPGPRTDNQGFRPLSTGRGPHGRPSGARADRFGCRRRRRVHLRTPTRLRHGPDRARAGRTRLRTARGRSRWCGTAPRSQRPSGGLTTSPTGSTSFPIGAIPGCPPGSAHRRPYWHWWAHH